MMPKVVPSPILIVIVLSITGAGHGQDGLVAHYPLDAGKGTIAFDASPLKHDGRIRDAGWVRTETGHALEFIGKAGRVDCGPGRRLNLKDTLTVCAWICPTASPTGEPLIVGEGPAQWGLTYYKTGNVYFYISSGGNNVRTPVSMYVWSHVAGTYDGDTLRLYVNGALKGERALPKRTAINSGGRIFIGGGSREEDAYYGFVDDVRVYDVALGVEAIRRAASRPPGDVKMPAASQQPRRAATRFFKEHAEPLAFKESEQALWLANRRVGIEFIRRSRGLCVSRIYGIKEDEDFLSDKATAHGNGFWQIQFRRDKGRRPGPTLNSLSKGIVSHQVERSAAAVTLCLKWNGLDLPGEPKAVDVEVLVTLRKDDPLSRWRINVANRSNTYGPWMIICPVLPLRPIGGDPKTNFLAAGKYRGRLVRAPFLKDLRRYHRSWNPGGYNMQFQALYDQTGTGLYLATDDGDGNIKEYRWVAHPAAGFIEYGVGHFPANIGYPKEDYRMPYHVRVGPFTGDWYDACQIYRAWALKQRWCSKGPLAVRKDIPPWYKQAPVTLVTNSAYGDRDVGPVRDGILAMLGFFDTELPICWYTWKKHIPRMTHYNSPGSPWRVPEARRYPCSNIHDGNYPALPALESFAGACKAIKEAGGHVKPYVCARIFDPGLNENAPLARQAKPHVVRSVDGSIRAGEGRANIAWRMCPNTEWWPRRMADTAGALIRNEHAGGIYFDTFVGGAIQCFDTGHGHPHGGANSPYVGARALATAVRDALKRADPQAVMSGENPAETAIELLDGFLYAYTHAADTVPMFATVYGDYIVRYGMTVAPKSKGFYVQCATLFAEGAQMGRLAPTTGDKTVGYVDNFESGSPYTEQMRFIRKLARYWRPQVGQKYLAYGRLLRPITFQQPHPMPTVSYSEDWMKRDGYDSITVSALQSGVFAARDGSLGIFVVNVTEKPMKLGFELTADRYPLLRSKSYRLGRIDENGRGSEVGPKQSDKIEYHGRVNGRDVLFLEARMLP